MAAQRHLFRNGVIVLAIGDALGAPAEFGERWMRELDPVREMRSGGIFEVPVGGWTDDTAMTLATLDSLRAGCNPEDIMRRFVSWLRTGEYSLFDEPIGIGKQILRAIERYEAEGDIRTCGGSTEMDNGNGSLMRILPVCLYVYQQKKTGIISLESAIDMIHGVYALTHNHPRSLIACGLYFFIVESILNGTSPLIDLFQAGVDAGRSFYQKQPYADELSHYARSFDLHCLSQIPVDEINSSGYVVDSFEAALLKAVNLGLDTDTIAAIAGGLAGLYYGYEAIPTQWLESLQQREQIKSLCACFDAKQTEV